jgi:hypothetical protein
MSTGFRCGLDVRYSGDMPFSIEFDAELNHIELITLPAARRFS